MRWEIYVCDPGQDNPTSDILHTTRFILADKFVIAFPNSLLIKKKEKQKSILLSLVIV